jgi:radical SAM superfamily enzyme YgiQ (UPF0313 family)
MKTLLVKPNNRSDHIQPPLGLGYLATALRNKGEVRIVDGIKERLAPAGLRRILARYKPDVVGFQCYTMDVRVVREALRAVKEIDNNIVTFIGGPHPSAMPEEAFRYFGQDLDFLFRGECEKSLPLFLELCSRGNIPAEDVPGLVWRQGDALRSNPVYLEENLDSLGFPAWDLLRPESYPESQHGAFYKKFPIAPIILTRGCPYQCTFCAARVVSGTSLRKRSVPHVIEEIKLLYNDHGIREFHVVDDNFTLDKEYAKGFLRELLRQNLDISWATPNGVRIDSLDEELLGLMKKSGLYLLSLGIESGSPATLQRMKKDLDIPLVRQKVALIRSFGLDIAGFFVIGFPGETGRDIEETIRLSLELDLVRANFFTYLPFPGTESYDTLIRSGELKGIKWERFTFMNTAYAPPGFSRRRLRGLKRQAFLRFFLRPRILKENLRGIRSPRHFFYLLRRFFHWIIRS